MNEDFTRAREISEHLDLSTIAGPQERDERLDAALEAARLEFMLAIEDGWNDLKKALEQEAGVPYIFVNTHEDTWSTLPPIFVEIESESENGYALSPYLPSAMMISERIAPLVDRSAFCCHVLEKRGYKILVVNALYAPTSFSLGREALITHLINHAIDPETRSLESRVGPWGNAVLKTHLWNSIDDETWSA